MDRCFAVSFCILVSVVLPHFIDTHTVHPPRRLLLHNRIIHIGLKENKTELASLDAQHSEWLVHLKSPITSFVKKQINTAITPHALGQYIPHNTFFLIAPRPMIDRLKKLSGVMGVRPYLASDKYHPNLTAQSINSRNQRLNVRLNILHPGLLTERLTKWQQHLSNVAHLRYVSADLVVATILKDDKAMDVIYYLSAQNSVHFISPVRLVRLQNKFAHQVIQGGFSLQSPIWRHGIHGEGEIVGVGDTGLDYGHCFFNDPTQEVVFNQPMQSHRKIFGYFGIGDHSDYLDHARGHGTHVAGSIAGNAICEHESAVQSYLSQYSGMAYQARLAIFDFEQHNHDLVVPDDFGKDYYSKVYDDGTARILCNSWGTESDLYEEMSFQTDKFLWEHKDFLPAFAVGNYGEEGQADSDYFMTISSPGNSKNALGVGSHRSSLESYVDNGFVNLQIRIGMRTLDIESSAFVVPIDSFHLSRAPIVLAEPLSACYALSGPFYNLEGHVLVIDNINCSLAIKAPYLAHTGASLVVMMSNSCEIIESGLPFSIVCVNVDNALRHLFMLPSSTVRFPVLDTRDLTLHSPNQLSAFSSRGPVPDGRIKPDILTVGEWIMSAESDGDPQSKDCSQNSLLAMAGTSMATPIAAGALALIRQYFREGYHIAGVPSESHSFSPSAALLKATIINSGQTIHSAVKQSEGSDTVIPVTPVPSFLQGYGRLELQQVLRFNDSSEFHQLFVSDDRELEVLDSHVFCFNVLSVDKKPFKATIVWTDYYPSLAASIQAVNDIDLVVRHSSDEIHLGNQLFTTDAEGKLIQQPDRLNNVEQVTLNDAALGHYAVIVSGAVIPHGPQPYALVVTGNFEVQPEAVCASEIKCPQECHGHGSCHGGICQCSAPYYGVACSLVSLPLPGAVPVMLNLTAFSWVFFDFVVDHNSRNYHHFVISAKKTSIAGDPNFYIAFNKMPTLVSYDFADLSCDTCEGAPSFDHSIVIPIEELQHGKYYLGVYGYCCDNFTVEISSHFSTSHSITVVVCCVVVGILGIICLCYYVYRKNRRRHYSTAMLTINPPNLVTASSLEGENDSLIGYCAVDNSNFTTIITNDLDYSEPVLISTDPQCIADEHNAQEEINDSEPLLRSVD